MQQCTDPQRCYRPYTSGIKDRYHGMFYKWASMFAQRHKVLGIDAASMLLWKVGMTPVASMWGRIHADLFLSILLRQEPLAPSSVAVSFPIGVNRSSQSHYS